MATPLNPKRLHRNRSRQHRPRSLPEVMDCMNPEVRASLDAAQFSEMERLVNLALPAKPAPKLVDLRFDIDLIYSRFFIVLFVGKDRRKSARGQPESRGAAVFNWLAAVTLLIGFNLTFCITLLLAAYLLKSAIGVDLLPGHFRGFGK